MFSNSTFGLNSEQCSEIFNSFFTRSVYYKCSESEIIFSLIIIIDFLTSLYHKYTKYVVLMGFFGNKTDLLQE